MIGRLKAERPAASFLHGLAMLRWRQQITRGGAAMSVMMNSARRCGRRPGRGLFLVRNLNPILVAGRADRGSVDLARVRLGGPHLRRMTCPSVRRRGCHQHRRPTCGDSVAFKPTARSGEPRLLNCWAYSVAGFTASRGTLSLGRCAAPASSPVLACSWRSAGSSPLVPLGRRIRRQGPRKLWRTPPLIPRRPA